MLTKLLPCGHGAFTWLANLLKYMMAFLGPGDLAIVNILSLGGSMKASCDKAQRPQGSELSIFSRDAGWIGHCHLWPQNQTMLKIWYIIIVLYYVVLDWVLAKSKLNPYCTWLNQNSSQGPMKTRIHLNKASAKYKFSTQSVIWVEN